MELLRLLPRTVSHREDSHCTILPQVHDRISDLKREIVQEWAMRHQQSIHSGAPTASYIVLEQLKQAPSLGMKISLVHSRNKEITKTKKTNRRAEVQSRSAPALDSCLFVNSPFVSRLVATPLPSFRLNVSLKARRCKTSFSLCFL